MEIWLSQFRLNWKDSGKIEKLWTLWTLLIIGTFPLQTVKAAFRPCEEKWGPLDPKIRLEWKEFVAEKKFRHRGGCVEAFLK